MTTDQLGWLAVLLLILGVITGALQYFAVAWVLVLAGVGLIVYAKFKG